MKDSAHIHRRTFCGIALSGIGVAVAGKAGITTHRSTQVVSNFSRQDWRDHFPNLRKGAVLVEVRYKTLHYWSEDGHDYRVYPTSTPMSSDLTRLGRTSIVGKKEAPSWRPTPAMLERNPEWPAFMPPGPDNPLGTHALYLTWQYYRIHGTHDDRKIGRRTSNGCIGLFNHHIAELYDLTKLGTQVLLI